MAFYAMRTAGVDDVKPDIAIAAVDVAIGR